jgi:hypothetical protein
LEINVSSIAHKKHGSPIRSQGNYGRYVPVTPEGKYYQTKLAFQRPASPGIILSTPEKSPRHNSSSSNSDSDVVFLKESKRRLDILHSPGYRNEKRQKQEDKDIKNAWKDLDRMQKDKEKESKKRKKKDKEHKDQGLPWLSKKKQGRFQLPMVSSTAQGKGN